MRRSFHARRIKTEGLWSKYGITSQRFDYIYMGECQRNWQRKRFICDQTKWSSIWDIKTIRYGCYESGWRESRGRIESIFWYPNTSWVIQSIWRSWWNRSYTFSMGNFMGTGRKKYSCIWNNTCWLFLWRDSMCKITDSRRSWRWLWKEYRIGDHWNL